MEKIVRNYLEIKSIKELKHKKPPNDKFFVEKVVFLQNNGCLKSYDDGVDSLLSAPKFRFGSH